MLRMHFFRNKHLEVFKSLLFNYNFEEEIIALIKTSHMPQCMTFALNLLE